MKNESDYPIYSSYITYSSQIEASLALLALNNSNHLNQKLNACYCTNKYCNSFRKGVEYINKDCYYLHEIADQNNIIINILNYAYDRINGIEGYSVSARALAIFSGLGFKDDSIINCHVVCSFQLFIFLENHLEKSGKTIVMIYNKKLYLFAGNYDTYKMTR